ncbi:protein of unknown function [Burkholderia multivorans]
MVAACYQGNEQRCNGRPSRSTTGWSSLRGWTASRCKHNTTPEPHGPRDFFRNRLNFVKGHWPYKFKISHKFFKPGQTPRSWSMTAAAQSKYLRFLSTGQSAGGHLIEDSWDFASDRARVNLHL